jgi:hypothetical protein
VVEIGSTHFGSYAHAGLGGHVLAVARVGRAPANEPAQPGLFPLDDVGDPLILFEGHPLQARRPLHLRL